MEQKLKRIFTSLFEISENEIDDNCSPETITKWDSIGHLNLVTSIEEEFNILLTEEQISEMLNYNLVRLVIIEAMKSNLD